MRIQYNKLLKPNATARQLIKILIKFFSRHQYKMNAKNVPFKPDFLSDGIAKLLRMGHLQEYNFFFFYKNTFYKNVEAEICEMLRINPRLRV